MKGDSGAKPPKKFLGIKYPPLNKGRFFGGKGGVIKRCGVVGERKPKKNIVTPTTGSMMTRNAVNGNIKKFFRVYKVTVTAHRRTRNFQCKFLIESQSS